MKLKSKFDCNQKVWHRFIGTKEVRTRCPECDGSGYLATKNNSSQSCRKCFGHGHTSEWVHNSAIVNGPYTIGQIGIEYTSRSNRESDFSNYGKQEESTKVQYMMYETGIGSGTLYYEESLFDSKEKAELFTDVEEVS